MIEKVDTVATQAMQLWLSPNLAGLGWPLPSTLVVNYESPGANWLDASQVIPFERLPPADRFGRVFLLRAAGPAEDPASWSEHLSRGSAPRRPAGPSTLDRAACRALMAGVDGHRGGPPSSTGTCSTIRTIATAPPGWTGSISVRTSNRPIGSCFRRWARPAFDCVRINRGSATSILPATGRTTSSMAAVSRAR